MLLIGQSLELHRPPLSVALAARAAAPLLARARAQLAAGAAALDLNAGVAGEAADLAWCAAALRAALPGVPLFLDAGSAAALAAAIERCARDGTAGPLVANALAAGELRSDAAAALLRAAAHSGAGLVLSPRDRDDPQGGASADRLAEAAREALGAARAAGVSGPCYVDALAYPAALDPARARRSLAMLRLLQGVGTPLVAVGNVGHGAPLELRPALRCAYAAAAAGAGAAALMLPAEERAVVTAVRVAIGEREPADDAERWLRAAAEACATGARVSAAPASHPELRAAARLLFG